MSLCFAIFFHVYTTFHGTWYFCCWFDVLNLNSCVVLGELFLVWRWCINWGFLCYVIACLMRAMVVELYIKMHESTPKNFLVYFERHIISMNFFPRLKEAYGTYSLRVGRILDL